LQISISGALWSVEVMMAVVTITGQTDFRDAVTFYRSLLGGDDRITVSAFADYVLGFGGDDLIRANKGADSVFGGSGNDTLIGGPGNDRLFGGTGADELNGGAGTDRLFAGDGRARDVFVFAAPTDSLRGDRRDVVSGFVSGQDDLSLTRIDADTGRAGDQAFAFSSSGPRAHGLWVVDIGTDLVVRGDVTGDRTADFEIEVAGLSRLVADDFLL
jgi:Ca2+-binding RTX toxin-like protein